jgi:ketosteroid isomerase-like protein
MRIINFFLTYTLLSLLITKTFAQVDKKEVAKEKVMAAQKNFAAVLTTQSWAQLPEILDDNLLYIHSFGRVDTKADFIKNIARFASIPRWEYTETKIQIYPKFAIISNNLFVTLKMQDGTEQISQQRTIEVWKKEKRNWILVSHQSTSYK